MLVYRIFPHLPAAAPGQPGHAEYLHPLQGYGRWDNPSDYLVWYVAREPSAAVGEVFGDFEEWTEGMFQFPKMPGARKALGVYWLPDDLPLLDFDDPTNLRARAIRPTQVVERNRPATQQRAKDVYDEYAPSGRRWAGLRWWSYHRPEWQNLAVWGAKPMLRRVEDLNLTSPCVEDAANLLRKIRRHP